MPLTFKAPSSILRMHQIPRPPELVSGESTSTLLQVCKFCDTMMGTCGSSAFTPSGSSNLVNPSPSSRAMTILRRHAIFVRLS